MNKFFNYLKNNCLIKGLRGWFRVFATLVAMQLKEHLSFSFKADKKGAFGGHIARAQNKARGRTQKSRRRQEIGRQKGRESEGRRRRRTQDSRRRIKSLRRRKEDQKTD